MESSITSITPINPGKETFEVYKDKTIDFCKMVAEKVDVFMEKHFVLILFSISCIAFIAANPLALIIGGSLGGLIHWQYDPDLSIKEETKILTITNTVFAVVGAMCALVRLTPAGQAGGLISSSIPWLASLAIGSTGYRCFSHFFPRKEGIRPLA